VTDSPKRRFQIHLSTAVVLMVSAGGLLWLNVHGWEGPEFKFSDDINGPEFKETYFGWPWYAALSLPVKQETIVWRLSYDINLILLDGAIGVLLLAITAFISEYLVRRREARKP
jgi:hypothetical protein